MIFQFRQKIGMRTVKTAVAVALCLAVGVVFRRESIFYACIAAVICMQPTVEKTFLAGAHRFIGTLLGAAVGLLVLVLSGLLPYGHTVTYVFLIPLAMILSIYLCLVIDRKDAVPICCVIYLGVVTSFSGPLPGAGLFVLARVIDTTIGIGIAVLVNKFIFPRRGSASLPSGK